MGFCFTILSTAVYVLNFPLIKIKRKRETCGLGPRTNTMAWTLRLASMSISESESKDLPWSRNLRKVGVASCSWSAFQTGTISSLCERGAAKQHLSPFLCRAPVEMGLMCPKEDRIGVRSRGLGSIRLQEHSCAHLSVTESNSKILFSLKDS